MGKIKAQCFHIYSNCFISYLDTISKCNTDQHKLVDDLDKFWVGQHAILEAVV